MNIKSLLSKLPSFKKSAGEYFFALNISVEMLDVAVWTIEAGQLKIISSKKSGWKEEDELIESVDDLLDECLGNMPIDPQKILFGVPESWTQDDNLKDEKLSLLRKLVKELSLVPMAFVSTSHAISHYQQKLTGAPTNAILVSLGELIGVSVAKSGKIIVSKSVKHNEDLAHDIEKALASFDDIEVLPSRIICYGYKHLNSVRDQLVDYEWMNKLPFLHIPKIDVLETEEIIQALCLAGAAEINPNVGFVPMVAATNLPIDEVKTPEKEMIESDNLIPVGEFEGDDLDNFDHLGPRDNIDSHLGETYLDQRVSAPAPSQVRYDNVDSGRKFSLPIGGFGTKPKMILIGIISLIVLLLVGYITMVKATVSVFIDAKNLEKEATVIADPSATALNQSKNIIPGKVVETNVSGSDTASATGKKQVGDPARGKVIIYNKTTSKKTYPVGTELVSTTGIKFKLDVGVNVASRSSEPGPDNSEVIKPGKSDSVGLTAEAIGADGNIAAGTKINVAGANIDDVFGQIDEAMAGGNSKDVTVITQDDQDRLLAKVSSDLRTKAQAQIQSKLAGDLKVLPEGLAESIVKSTFSKSVGDAVSDFSVNVNSNYKGTAYSDNDLKQMVSKLVEQNLPAGYEYNLADAQTQAAATKLDKDGKLYFNAKFIAKLKPKIDLDSVKKQIAGKSVTEAADILKKQDQVIGSSVKFSPNLPGFLQRLPFLPGNITLDIVAK